MQEMIGRISVVAAALMLAGAPAVLAQSTEREQNPQANQNTQSAQNRQENNGQTASSQSGSRGDQKTSRSQQYIDYNVVNQQS